MPYFQIDPTSNTVTGGFANAQPDNPNVVELPDTDPRVLAWRGPSKGEAEAERARRLALGFNYTFPDARGTHRIGTTEKDMEGWDEVSKLAAAYIATGTPGSPMTLVTNTGPVTVTAIEWQQILLTAAQFRQPIWQASFVLEASGTIPADYTADYHWPPLT